MDKLAIILLTWVLVSCSEEHTASRQDNSSNVSNSPIVGTWVLVEQKVSIGGPATWQDVDAGDTLRFRADGSFAASQSRCSPESYQATDSLIQLSYDCSEVSGIDSVNYRIIELTDEYLTVGNTSCIEECVYKYTRAGAQ